MLKSNTLVICVTAMALLVTTPSYGQASLPDDTNSVAMTAIVAWLSANFDLPTSDNRPQVKLVSSTQLAAMRYRGLLAGGQPVDAAAEQRAAAQGRDLVAVYDDASRTIYLQHGWTVDQPAQVSVLVHEMVHHLQNLAGLKYECPQAREELAYAAQDRWLGQFGRSLESEFGIDPMSRLVKTKCLG